MKYVLVVLLFIVSSYLFPSIVYSQSSYVLPYPSTMPGSKAYLLHQVYEELSRYWYFGDFSQFSYNLKYADKYLVEAKTLFEYKQYLLGYSSLEKSNAYFDDLELNLEHASRHNKDISDKTALLKEAALKHIETLDFMKTITPKEFTWVPEKNSPTHLNIEELLSESIEVRKKVL